MLSVSKAVPLLKIKVFMEKDHASNLLVVSVMEAGNCQTPDELSLEWGRRGDRISLQQLTSSNKTYKMPLTRLWASGTQ